MLWPIMADIRTHKRMRKIFFLYTGWCLAFLGAADAAQEAASSHVELTQQAIQDRVKVMRQERSELMPYLDRGYIRSTLHPDKIRAKTHFLSGGEKRLEEVLRRAIQVYTPARAARERISLARRRILVAFRNLFPEAKFDYQLKEGALSSNAFNSQNYRFSFRQPVFRGGILWNTLLQEQAGLQAAENDHEKTVSDLVRDVSEAYFDYHRALRATHDQAEAIGRMKRFAGLSQRKFDEKIISEIEHLNVQSLFSQMQYDHETAVQELELAKLELQKYLDLEIGDALEVVGLYSVDELLASVPSKEMEAAEPEEELESGAPEESRTESETPTEQTPSYFEGELTLPDLAELVDLGYEHRPELQVEAAKLQSAILDERINMGELLPHADFVLEFGKLGEAFDINDSDPGLRKEFRAMVELTWNMAGNEVAYTFENDERAPSVSQFLSGSGTQTTRNSISFGLWDGLKAFVSAKQAEAEKLDQIAELEKAEKEVVHDIKQAYFDYQKARIQMRSSLKRVDYRHRLARLAEHRMGQNEIQVSEYMQAEIDLLRELTDLHKAYKDYFTAKSSLNRAVGVRDFLPIEDSHGK